MSPESTPALSAFAVPASLRGASISGQPEPFHDDRSRRPSAQSSHPSPSDESTPGVARHHSDINLPPHIVSNFDTIELLVERDAFNYEAIENGPSFPPRTAKWFRMPDTAIALKPWKIYLRQTDGAATLDQKRISNRDSRAEWREARQTAPRCSPQGGRAERRRDHQPQELTEIDANSDGLSYDAAGTQGEREEPRETNQGFARKGETHERRARVNCSMTACRPDKDGDWSKGYTIVWDAWNRIVQVKNAQTSATVASFAYDGLTRRTTTTIGSTVRHFYYNNLWSQADWEEARQTEQSEARRATESWGGSVVNCVEERVGSSTNPDRVYYWSTRPGHRDELLRRDRATSGGALNETLWCLMDYFDPIAITDTSGTIQERYTYTAFGLASILTPSFAPLTTSSFAWNFLFHGQFRDAETGWDNYGYRYYLPWLGRWPSRDPIGEDSGVNLYQFVNAINHLDQLGLFIFMAPPPTMILPRMGPITPRPIFPTPRPIPQPNPNPSPHPSPSPSPRPYPQPPIPLPPSEGGNGCKPCDPPEGTRICEFAPKGSRQRGAHKKGGPKDCDHCKFWKVGQNPNTCECFWNYDGTEENCDKCPDGMGAGPPKGKPGGGGKISPPTPSSIDPWLMA